MSENAHAAQTFLCDGGRVLQVELQDLERLKREDACVASHYGIVAKPVPLPVQRPVRTVVRAFKGSKTPAPADREIGGRVQVTTNFRNVRIINARRGSVGWFQHRR